MDKDIVKKGYEKTAEDYDEHLKTIKILIFSAKTYPADREDREMAFAIGAEAYLVKSDLFHVIEQVEALIGRPTLPDNTSTQCRKSG